MVDRTPVDLPDLAEMVGKYDEVLLRVGLVQRVNDDTETVEWLVTRGELVLNPSVKTHRRLWRYPSAILLECRVSGPVAASLLSGKAQKVESLTIVPATTQTSTWAERIAGQQRWSGRVTAWPRTEWGFSSQETAPAKPEGMLIGEGPSHLNYESATSAFFDAGPVNHNARSVLWTVIRHDRRAWLNRITITADSLVVEAAGENLDGVILELTNPTSNRRTSLQSGRAGFDLPDGIVQHSLLLLRNEFEWLDYRYFDNLAPAQKQDPSVEWEQPANDLQILIAQGEGQHVEFKEFVPQGKENAQDRETKRKFLKTVAAFASWNSGTVLVGVHDDGIITGIPTPQRDELGRMVTALIRDNIF